MKLLFLEIIGLLHWLTTKHLESRVSMTMAATTYTALALTYNISVNKAN